MNGLNYLLQTNLYLLLFMGFYVLVLRNETFFKQNRFFLNTSIFLSFLIPFINSDWFRNLFITQKVREAAIVPSQMIYETVIVGMNDEANGLTASGAIVWIYTIGAIILTLRLILRLVLLKSNLKAGKGAAFSFFKTLVIDKDMAKIDTIIDHEKVHMRQWHSADIIFIELAAIVNWFNPIMYLYKKEVRHIHEFIADDEAANLMQSKSDYALLLFSNTLGVDPMHLSNNFFNRSLLKRRVLMLHKTKSRSTGLWKYGFSAPLFMLMLVVSAATVSAEKNALSVDARNSIDPLKAISSINIFPEQDNNAKHQRARTGDSFIEDGKELKTHITKNIKYPVAARNNKITGYVLVNFTVNNNRITKTEIAKGLHVDIDADVLKVFSLYTDPLQLENKDYSLAIYYQLTGVHNAAEVLPAVRNTYLGQVVVTAMGIPENRTSNYETAVTKSTGQSINDFASVDVLPEFEGGMNGWGEYLQQNLKYPDAAKNNKIEGRVILAFVVLKDGSITDIKVLRSLGSGLDEEAVRVVAQSPKWKPGLSGGRPVNVAYTMPIFFQLGQPVTNLTVNPKPPLSAGVADFSTVEVLPEFAGGMGGWARYLSLNLKYPQQARDKKTTGRVILSFIVEKDGSLSDIKVLRGIGDGADEEAVRVLKSSPNWKAGIMNGRPVRVAYTMPIFFQLSDNKDAPKTGEVKPNN